MVSHKIRAALVAALLVLVPLAGAAGADAVPMKKKWYSSATCAVEKIGSGDHGDKQLKGNGTGKSKKAAENAAQSDVQAQISQKYGTGYRAHHCTFRSVFK
ncbi:hypothetical protein KQY30_01845 [Streptomyces sp. GMY02]|uniref:hypothetical protein n=1 Tax=Streptomyces sp. GMY02 TaxID=1333528 RepID=UPI001C2B90A9|nr:hypothetical protein [Streptomyces sp. GMY02]QXE33226.1 hypothetical protein KQY30_01845 [Streptomyces sp. GMY02]